MVDQNDPAHVCSFMEAGVLSFIERTLAYLFRQSAETARGLSKPGSLSATILLKYQRGNVAQTRAPKPGAYKALSAHDCGLG